MKVKEKVAKYKEKKDGAFKYPKMKKAKHAIKEFVSKKTKRAFTDSDNVTKQSKSKIGDNDPTESSPKKKVKKESKNVKDFKETENKDVTGGSEVQEKKKRNRNRKNKKKKKKMFSKRNKYLHLILPNLNRGSATITPEEKSSAQQKPEKAARLQPDSSAATVGARKKKKNKRKHENEESEPPTKKLKTDTEQCHGENEVLPSKSKKKKKSHVNMVSDKAGNAVEITNIETLKQKRKKKRKHADNSTETSYESNAKIPNLTSDNDENESAGEIQNGWHNEQLKKKKKKKRNESDPTSIIEQSKTLKDRMVEKLSASRFRYLNEQLYNMTGKGAYELFQNDPSAFEVYHNGFKNQVAKWPMNPLKVVIKSIKLKPSSLVVADFGCGDATLARKVKNTVHSFDLVAVNDSIVSCDMSKVPLKSASVDIAVFCLSLMGTNIIDYIQEAHRVLKSGGTLKIAEVESRFRNVDHFIKALQRLGFTLLSKDLSQDMFVFFDFEKSGQFHRNRVSKLKLNPCLYKKR